MAPVLPMLQQLGQPRLLDMDRDMVIVGQAIHDVLTEHNTSVVIRRSCTT